MAVGDSELLELPTFQLGDFGVVESLGWQQRILPEPLFDQVGVQQVKTVADATGVVPSHLPDDLVEMDDEHERVGGWNVQRGNTDGGRWHG